ncbi:hypothetical protein M885DRAFT_507790 [Pelagophyceae sp. CCMP2097]|nr:hypothetical protein M885DRAFT_507790 [Pelagophyceae sp. CCMP2097]
MANDEEFQMTAAMLRELGTAKVTLEEKKRRRRALENVGAPDFKAFLQEHAQEGQSDAVRRSASVLQLNIGLYCNQACAHCHVESSPQRKESMSEAVAVRCLQVLDKSRGSVRTLDLTGGAPELNPQFRMIVERARRQDSELEIIDRCNLTVLTEPGQEDLPQFLADHRVRVVASLPCYSAKNVNAQRGRGVFDRSIAALRMLNAHGFGVAASGLHMDLVYNPLGAFLPPAQAALEAKYRDELRAEFGVEFSQLFTITNMPIKRFADFLHRRGELEEYMKLLVQSFNVKTTTSTMCRDTVSVNWDGAVFDCDFNQQLGLGLPRPGNNAESSEPKMTIFDMHATDDLLSTPIAFDNHCFGCTAGAGSS